VCCLSFFSTNWYLAESSKASDGANCHVSPLYALHSGDCSVAGVFRFAEWAVFGSFDSPRLATNQSSLLVPGCLDSIEIPAALPLRGFSEHWQRVGSSVSSSRNFSL
jgi:hypothetical protein